MSKIICEICGTVYPDNATQCPICGYPRKGEQKQEPVETEAAAAAAPAAERAKGGHFSNNNVKKRNQGAQPEQTPRPRRAARKEPENSDEGKNRDSRGLLITMIVLLAAVILVSAYIGIRFFRGADAYDKAAERNASQTTPSSDPAAQPSTQPEDTSVPCTNLVLSDSGVQFVGTGRAWLLSVTAVPADTTDTITYSSSDDSVATVSAEGRITSVGAGNCTITITCGSVTKECKVVCDFAEETEPTDESGNETGKPSESTASPTETTQKEGFNLSHTDVTFSFKGDNFTFNAGKGISNVQVAWASGDPNVATVSSNGKVVAVGPGTTEITATYEGQTQKCIIRCNFKADETTATEATDGTDETASSDTSWKISKEDVTIAVGESFTLTVTNDSGETASVSWSVADAGKVSVSGNTVTGKASGITTVSCQYNGTTFSCIVRVK